MITGTISHIVFMIHLHLITSCVGGSQNYTDCYNSNHMIFIGCQHALHNTHVHPPIHPMPVSCLNEMKTHIITLFDTLIEASVYFLNDIAVTKFQWNVNVTVNVNWGITGKYPRMEKFVLFDQNCCLSQKQYKTGQWLVLPLTGSHSELTDPCWFWWPWVTFKGTWSKDLSNARIVWPKMSKFCGVMHMGKVIFLRGPPHPHPKGWCPSIPKNFSDSYLRLYGLTYSDQIWYGRACF